MRISRCNLLCALPTQANHVTSLGLTFIICKSKILIPMPSEFLQLSDSEILEPTLAQTEGLEVLPMTLSMPKWS